MLSTVLRARLCTASASSQARSSTRRVGATLISDIVGNTAGALAPSRRCLATAASEAKDQASTAKQAVAGVVLAGITCSTAYLCYWQVKRYSWKLEKIEERRDILHREPRPLRELVPNLADGVRESDVFARVACEGVFDHTCQVLLGPRSAPAGMGSTGPTGAPSTTGWDVVTPLVLDDGSRVLVNRGWVERASGSSNGHGTPAAILQPQGRQLVEGVLKEGEKENKYGFNDVANARYRWLDLSTIAGVTGSDPVLVVATADDPANPLSFPRARPVDSFMSFYVEPSTHATYAATWGSLTVAGVFMTARFIRGR